MSDFDLDLDLDPPFRPPLQGPQHVRHDFDNYATPLAVVEAGYKWLQTVLGGFRPKHILEPGCGDTAPFLVAAPWDTVEYRTGCDIRNVNTDYPTSAVYGNHDFLEPEGAKIAYVTAPNLIAGNPPYALAEEFMLKSLEVLAPYGYCMFLLRLSFLASQRRYKLWTEQVSLQHVGVLSRRPSFTGDGASDGKTDYCWMVFQKRREPRENAQATLSWVKP